MRGRVRVKGSGFSAFQAAVILLVVGAGAQLVAWEAGVEAERMRTGQVTVDGTITELTTRYATLDVGGERMSMPVSLKFDKPDAAGQPVRVTVYHHEPVRITGAGLDIQGENAPDPGPLRGFGILFLVLGVAAAGVHIAGKATARPDR